MQLRLIRHATLRLELGGRHLLVDPMLDPAGTRPGAGGSADDPGEPLVELPEPVELVVAGVDAVLLSRLHPDHFDATAAELLPHDVPLLCQPGDAEALRSRGFHEVRPVETATEWEGIAVTRIPARRAAAGGTGPDTSGFLLRDAAGHALYLAGDTGLDEAVEAVLDEHRPDVVVVHAGAVRAGGGDALAMDADEVIAVARRVPAARVVAVHLDAVGGATETRADLHQRLHEEQLTEHVTVPEDGATVPVE